MNFCRILLLVSLCWPVETLTALSAASEELDWSEELYLEQSCIAPWALIHGGYVLHLPVLIFFWQCVK